MQMAFASKQIKIQLFIKNTQADVMTIEETKLNQSHKTQNIPHFIPIRTDHTNKQGGGLLTYIKNNISFSQLNTSNSFPIDLQIIKIHLSTSKQLHITNMSVPPKHSTLLLQTEDSIISNMFTTITNLSSTIITADVNIHLSLWYLPTKEKTIEDN